MDEQVLTGLVRKALWHDPVDLRGRIDEEIYQEMKAQGIAVLVTSILEELDLPEQLLRTWEGEAVRQIACYYQYIRLQSELPVKVPYVILKGTSAAQYYPEPEYRAMGDIDIMTRHEDQESACQELLAHGYREVTEIVNKTHARHREFTKNGIEVEVHTYYGTRNNALELKRLDDLIMNNITSTRVLPDLVNGITLIEHVNHHMESGLGLRQIIDWMMFVDRCLPDEQWPAFQQMAHTTGHERLAQVVTRMCELYLGLPERKWCACVEEGVCRQLMDYVLHCGNFGKKIPDEETASIRMLSGSRSVKGMLQILRKRGLINSPAAQRHPILRPFSTFAQFVKYMTKGMLRKNTLQKLIKEIKNSRQRNQLFDALGVAREANGLAFYVDGQYKDG